MMVEQEEEKKNHATATYFSNIFMECGQELENFFFFLFSSLRISKSGRVSEAPRL